VEGRVTDTDIISGMKTFGGSERNPSFIALHDGDGDGDDDDMSGG